MLKTCICCCQAHSHPCSFNSGSNAASLAGHLQTSSTASVPANLEYSNTATLQFLTQEQQHSKVWQGVKKQQQQLTLARGFRAVKSSWRVSSTSLRYKRRLKRPTPNALAIHRSAHLRARMCSSCAPHISAVSFGSEEMQEIRYQFGVCKKMPLTSSQQWC